MTQKKKKTTGRKKKTTAKQVKETKALVPAKPKEDEGIEGDVMPDTGEDRFGRPTVMTEAVKKKLHEAFAFGCSNKEAALYAGISEQTLNNYNKKDPEFKDRSEELKLNPVLKARMQLVKTAAKSPYYALKLLERLKSDEFSLRVRQFFDDPEPLTPEEEEALNDALDDNL